jgi:hypothetical protein
MYPQPPEERFASQDAMVTQSPPAGPGEPHQVSGRDNASRLTGKGDQSVVSGPSVRFTIEVVNRAYRLYILLHLKGERCGSSWPLCPFC